MTKAERYLRRKLLNDFNIFLRILEANNTATQEIIDVSNDVGETERLKKSLEEISNIKQYIESCFDSNEEFYLKNKLHVVKPKLKQVK